MENLIMGKAEIKDRIKKAMEIREIRQTELVERTGIDKGQMSSYISGKYKPKQRNINLLAQALSVDEAWLMGFDVPMEGTSGARESSPEILQYYNKLNDIGKHKATERVRELTEIPRYVMENSNYINAAHADDYSSAPEELKREEEDIMDDENF